MRESRLAKRPVTLAVIILLISALFCIVCGTSLYFARGIPTVYWSVASNIYVAPFVITTLGLSLLVLFVTRIFRKFQFGLFLLASAFSCMCLFSLYWGSMTHQDSITYNGHVYHLALKNDAQWSDYILCECDSSGIVCQCHTFYSRYALGRPVTNTLSVDTATNELYVSAGEDIIYAYGTTQRCFNIDGECLDK